MIRIAVLLFMFALAAPVSASDLCNSIFTATREYQSAGHFYLVEYEYDADLAMYRNNGEDKPHYPARVTVYEIVQGMKIRAGNSFHAFYVPGGCIEDRPADMVYKALSGQ